jgi:SAM-dependent methyltransferase
MLGRAARPSTVFDPDQGGEATREAVAWAYRLFLDREPESESVIDERMRHRLGTRALRAGFLESDEYRVKNPPALLPVLQGDEPAMEIDSDLPEADCRLLFDRVQAAWQRLGENDPFWSVLTSEQYRPDQIGQHSEQFWESGRWDVQRLMRTLDRNGLDQRELRDCLEYGCGLGRLTRWLSAEFESVHGVDISRAHLRIAEAYLRHEGVGNATLGHLARLKDLETLPRVDLVYTVIVLQHNPPPVIRHVLHRLLRALKPGGVAYFQVPTYLPGYRFRLDEYLGGATGQNMEMHVLPQRTIFEVMRAEGCIPLEVLEDTATGPPYSSNTFLVRKA